MTSTKPVQVTLVTGRGCHFCEDARRVLGALEEIRRLTVEEIRAESPAGQALVLEHGTGMLPLVLIDGAFFSAGRLPRGKLARSLTRPAPVLTGTR